MTTPVRSSRDIILRARQWTEAVSFKAAPHGPVLDFLTPQVSAVRDRFLAAGCTLIEESTAAPRCYRQDPFGLVFNLGKAASGR